MNLYFQNTALSYLTLFIGYLVAVATDSPHSREAAEEHESQAFSGNFPGFRKKG